MFSLAARVTYPSWTPGTPQAVRNYIINHGLRYILSVPGLQTRRWSDQFPPTSAHGRHCRRRDRYTTGSCATLSEFVADL
jgi:hypothetical protein